MCGICGYVGTNRPELLKAMCDTMVHRGPDDEGQWYDAQAGVGLGHRRLSIIDLSPAGHQPMANANGTVQLVYNGEIYDFQEHREFLLSKGYRFRGHSDTEVVLYLYEEYGVEVFQKLNGIFALSIWDSKRRELILVRDHAGVKPLYYWQDGARLYFASELKALLRIPEIPRRVNESVVSEYLTFLWVPGENTMLKDIRKVEPGHYLVWKDGEIQTRQWFELDYSPDESISPGEWVEKVRDTFVRTTRRQMVSDVPLGAFLSGGLDSSSIVACMRHCFPDREIKCYTITCDEAQMAREGFVDDTPYAEKVAGLHNIVLKKIRISEDIQELFPKIVYHLDEPDADPAAILTYIISRDARDDGIKVLLSGTGGDELFFGYRSHQAYRYFGNFNKFPKSLTGAGLCFLKEFARLLIGPSSVAFRRTKKLSEAFRKSGLERHLALANWSSVESRGRILSEPIADLERRGNGIPSAMQKYYDLFIGSGEVNRHSHVLINTFLADHNFLYTDKATMAASVEGRVPFMDIELMRLVSAIPEKTKFRGKYVKPLLGQAMKPFLPKEIIQRKKTGFGAPIRSWIHGGLEGFIRESLSEERISQRGFFRGAGIQRILEENRSGQADHAYLIYALLSLEIWMQTFIDKPGVEVSI